MSDWFTDYNVTAEEVDKVKNIVLHYLAGDVYTEWAWCKATSLLKELFDKGTG